MLDVETKKIIDNARDILVGKLPAPNTQVEQITLAMLYKFEAPSELRPYVLHQSENCQLGDVWV